MCVGFALEQDSCHRGLFAVSSITVARTIGNSIKQSNTHTSGYSYPEVMISSP